MISPVSCLSNASGLTRMSVRSVAIGAGTYTYRGFGANTGNEWGRNYRCGRLVPDIPEEVDRARRDTEIARIAARQHGVVSAHQLKWLGMPSSAVGDRVTAGRLHRIHRGVNAVGHAGLSDRGQWMAAVLACGPNAMLSHTSAAEL